MWLIDTNVLSAIRKRDVVVLHWLAGVERGTSWISVIALGEIARGVAMKRRRDPLAADHLSSWLAKVRTSYLERTIDVDEMIAREWGIISSQRTRNDADGLIAATALVRDLTLVTRNVADFADTGVKIVNPWQL